MENHQLNSIPLLYVRNLDEQVDFYAETIGLGLMWREGRCAALGDAQGEVILLAEGDQLTMQFAVEIDVGNRRELARIIGRLCTIGYKNEPLDKGDRHVTRLLDIEGNRIEIGVSVKGNLHQEPCSLDLESLLNELHPDDRLCDKILGCRLTLNET